MYNFRKEDISVFMYLKDITLADFIEFQEGDSLNFRSDMSTDTSHIYEIESYMETDPFGPGRGIVYFDDLSDEVLIACTTSSGTKEQRERVFLYDEGFNLIDDSLYMVDYIDGRLIVPSDVTPKYIDYYWNYVGLIDEWRDLASPEPPIVALELTPYKKDAYQLGGGKKIIRKGVLHVFASSSAERNDITEVLYDGLYLRSCPMYDLSSGTVLDYDGTFTGRKTTMDKDSNIFYRTTVSGIDKLEFHNVEAKNVSLPAVLAGSDNSRLNNLNSYRSKITFNLISYN